MQRPGAAEETSERRLAPTDGRRFFHRPTFLFFPFSIKTQTDVDYKKLVSLLQIELFPPLWSRLRRCSYVYIIYISNHRKIRILLVCTYPKKKEKKRKYRLSGLS